MSIIRNFAGFLAVLAVFSCTSTPLNPDEDPETTLDTPYEISAEKESWAQETRASDLAQ